MHHPPTPPPEPTVVISDLDGTLANVDHRLHHILEPPADWDAFFLACADDPPILRTITVLRHLHAAGYEIVIVSGRGEIAREMTVAWLERHRVPCDLLLLRDGGDDRPDDAIKRDLVAAHDLMPERTLVVLEDRAFVVRFWRERGYHVFQVADGDF
ncbi:MAG: hypothetical protein WD336_05225 [Trueperaceae bacterium]